MHCLNVEIKAKCADPEAIRVMLMSRNANFIGEDHQLDTYFKVKNGRLKLREGNIENALIHYVRSDEAGPKRSEVLLYKATPGSSLKALLTVALGVLAVVDKKRAIFFIDNVKFHIDEVKGLGSFVEIEAIDKDGSLNEQKLFLQCQNYLSLFGIKESDLLETSYSDMIIQMD